MSAEGTKTRLAMERLEVDAEAWRLAERAHEEALDERRANILRAVREDGLSLKTVGDAYGVTRQYVGQITADS